MDLLGRIIKAEMLEQHGGGEDGGGRVGLVLTGDVRSGTVNRLEHGRELVGGVDAAGGGVAHAAHHGAGLIGQNVAKEVVGENHIETARVGDQEDGGRIDVLVVVGDLRVFLADLVDDALPHITGVDEHVLLVHQGDVLLALHSKLEGVTHHTLHTVCGVDGHLGGHLLRGVAAHRAAGTAVQTFGAFTHHHEVDVAGVGERRGDALVQLGGAQVHVLVEVEAQLEQQAAFQNAGLDARIAHGAEQNRVVGLDAPLFVLGQDRTIAQIALGTQVEILILEVSYAFSGLFQSLLSPRSDFLANTVAGNNGDFICLCHSSRSLLARPPAGPNPLS